MAAACDIGEATGTSTAPNDDLTETQFVAQAITELQELIPAVHQGEPPKTDSCSQGTSTEQHVSAVLGSVSEGIQVLSSDLTQENSGQSVGVATATDQQDHIVDQGLLGEHDQGEVILLIEDSDISRGGNKQLVDSAVQANDYEIERRSGRVPARKRVIPFKFRDYRSGDASDREESDSDYEPESRPKFRRSRGPDVIHSRTRGRPRKYSAVVPYYSDGQLIKAPADGQLPNTETSNSETTSDITLTDIKSIPLIEEAIHENISPGDASIHLMGREKRGRGRPRGQDYEKFYTCSICNKSFRQKGNLKTHLRIHSDDRPFRCTEQGCEKSFRSNESLRRHVMSHKGVKLFECTICNKKFSSNTSLQEHVSRHTNMKPYECKVCHRHFRQISCLRRHLITHSTDLPYACGICNRHFSQMVYLRSHMKSHTGEKPFSCDKCGRKFAHQSDVTRHAIVHTGEKPFQCGICGAKFSDRSSKRRHEKEHANKKPYNCGVCNDTFKRAGQLKSHLHRMHSAILHLKIEKECENVFLRYENEDLEVNRTIDLGESQQRIVKLIENLHNKSNVQHVEIQVPSANGQKGELKGLEKSSIVIGPEQTLSVSQMEKGSSILEGADGIPIELQGVEIQEADASEEQTYIALADLAESLIEKGEGGENVEYSYRIIQAAGADGEQQIQVVQYTPDEVSEVTEILSVSDTAEGMTEAIAPDSVPEQTHTSENPTESVESNTTPLSSSSSLSSQVESQSNVPSVITTSDNAEKVAPSDADTNQSLVDIEKTVDYVKNPDFSSQGYYNWLSNFTELCKLVPMPLDVSLFQKISQVHKTLSDVMATPSGVIADKENFRVLMNISKELSAIINDHLLYVMQNLNQEEKG